MSVVQALGLAAAVLCLLAYARGGRVFDWANAVLWPVVLVSNVAVGAWGGALLNVGFGVVGVWHLLRERPRRRAEREYQRKLAVRERANHVLLEAADGDVLYYAPPEDR